MNNIPGFKFFAAKKEARFVVILPGTRGLRRRKKTVAASTMAVALAEWKKFRDHVLANATQEMPETFGQFIERYGPMATDSDGDHIQHLSPKARALEDGTFRLRLLPFFGEMRLEKITVPDLADYVAKHRARGKLSGSVINRDVRLVRKYLNAAVARRVLETSPLRGELPRLAENRPTMEMSDDERRRYLAAFEDVEAFRADLAATQLRTGKAAESDYYGGKVRNFGGGRLPDSEAAGDLYLRFRWLRPLFVVALETGLRQGDLLALRWADVDLDGGWIGLTMGKTKRPVKVAITAACRAALNLCKSRKADGPLVFTNKDGDPVSLTTLNRYHGKAKRLAGITRRLRFHDLRHTFASRLASKGISLQVIASALGHTSTKMSERYARPDDDARRSVVAALAETAAQPVPVNLFVNPQAVPVTEAPAAPLVQKSVSAVDSKTSEAGRNGAGEGDRTLDIQLGNALSVVWTIPETAEPADPRPASQVLEEPSEPAVNPGRESAIGFGARR